MTQLHTRKDMKKEDDHNETRSPTKPSDTIVPPQKICLSLLFAPHSDFKKDLRIKFRREALKNHVEERNGP